MAFFTAIGTISNDIVRRETKNGVVATFRLETGAPRGRKLWIDIQCWGHLAGTVAQHGRQGRGVAVSGRLASAEWRDRATGRARSRLLVHASHVDLLHAALAAENHVTAAGRVSDLRTAASVTTFTLQIRGGGGGRSKLNLPCRTWSNTLCAASSDPTVGLAGLGGALTFDAESRRQALWVRTTAAWRAD